MFYFAGHYDTVRHSYDELISFWGHSGISYNRIMSIHPVDWIESLLLCFMTSQEHHSHVLAGSAMFFVATNPKKTSLVRQYGGILLISWRVHKEKNKSTATSFSQYSTSNPYEFQYSNWRQLEHSANVLNDSILPPPDQLAAFIVGAANIIIQKVLFSAKVHQYKQ